VLARLPGVANPVIQVVAASASRGPNPVARALAISAAQRFGRTLLIYASDLHSQDVSVRGLSWLMSELKGEISDDKMPDSTIEALYHLRLHKGKYTPSQMNTWFAEPHKFALIVVSSPSISTEPKTLTMAGSCHGSILAVEAGRTRAEDVVAEVRQMACSGIQVLGCVLHDAPRYSIKSLWRSRSN
jgi:Mrp family chromosome partitioning ATPase